MHVYERRRPHPHFGQSSDMSEHVSQPPNYVFRALDRMDRTLTAASPIAVAMIGITSVYYVAFSYGLAVVGLLFGRERAGQVIATAPYNPLLVFVGVPAIPALLVMLEGADLDGRGIAMWRREISPRLSEVPFVGGLIEKVWPTPIRVPYTSSQGPESPIERLARSLSAGLLLPFAAYGTGKTLFKCVKSTPKQVVLGGVVFFVLKILLKMYLRQQEFRQQGSRRVLDYSPNDYGE